jgi:hypothetical protein
VSWIGVFMGAVFVGEQLLLAILLCLLGMGLLVSSLWGSRG